MNDVRPFRGLRFDESVTGPLESVLCPPYDVISPLEQIDLFGRSPHNAVRIEFGLTYPEDREGEDRYSRAAATMERWLAEGALKSDREPAIYLYEHSFQLDGRMVSRRGLLTRMRLTPWDAGVVLPHEETMAKPKEDRLKLMQATACNVSPLFILFDDPSRGVDRLISETASETPSAEADPGDGQVHRLWVVRGDRMEAILAALREPQLYMADGHHRYETALAYRDLMAASDPGASPDAPYNFALAMLVDSRDEGLVVLPTHRLILQLDAARLDPMDGSVSRFFQAERVATAGEDPAGTAASITRRMRELASEAPVLGFYGGEGNVPLVLRPRGGANAGPSGKDRPVLDVDLLHDLVLKPLLGIGEEELRAGNAVGYTRDAAEAVEAVDSGRAFAAFFLNPTRVEQVLETARAGGKMPQKSTYFYPKPATGLVFNPLK